MAPEELYTFGPFRLDIQRRRILENGEPVRWWSRRRFELLKTLIDAGGEVVSYASLIEDIWRSGDVLIHTIVQTANDLRRCLGAYGDCIENQHGIGYRFRRPPKHPRTIASANLDLQTLTLYSLAVEEFGRRSRQSLVRALTYFRAVVERHPQFVPAVLGIADCLTLLGHGGFPVFRPTDILPETRATAAKVLELATDPQMKASGYAAIGKIRLMFDWNWADAELNFRRALSLDPANASAQHGLAHLFLITNRWTESLTAIAEARRYAPASAMIHGTSGWLLHFMGRYAEAIAICQTTTELHPQFPAGHVMLAAAYQSAGRYREAKLSFQRSYELEPAPAPFAGLANLQASSGKAASAERIIRKLSAMASPQLVVSPYFLALGHAGLGDEETALGCLEQACSERFDWMVHLGVEPRWRVLHRHRRFRKLLEHVGLYEFWSDFQKRRHE